MLLYVYLVYREISFGPVSRSPMQDLSQARRHSRLDLPGWRRQSLGSLASLPRAAVASYSY